MDQDSIPSAMTEAQVLGLPLSIDLGDEDYYVIPLSAVVIMKGMDNEGNDVWITTMTDGLTPVDALSYIHFADEHCTFELRKTFYASTE
jgi:hypothetical protein